MLPARRAPPRGPIACACAGVSRVCLPVRGSVTCCVSKHLRWLCGVVCGGLTLPLAPPAPWVVLLVPAAPLRVTRACVWADVPTTFFSSPSIVSALFFTTTSTWTPPRVRSHWSLSLSVHAHRLTAKASIHSATRPTLRAVTVLLSLDVLARTRLCRRGRVVRWA